MNGKLLIGNDNTVTLTLKEEGVAVTAAAVIMELRDSDGVLVPGQAWPTALLHDGDGVYIGGLQDTLTVREADRYYLHVFADAGGGKRFRQRVRLSGAFRE